MTFAEPDQLGGFERKMELPYRVYGDPERAAYRAFGFERASVARVWLDPRVWARYAAILAGGRRPEPSSAKQDALQLGGDAVLDRTGLMRWIHRSRGPADRPAVDDLVAAAREAR